MASRLESSYKTLGLRRGASLDEVRKARRKLALKWHPDLFQDPELQQKANRRIQQINAAYSYLAKVKGQTGSATTSQKQPPRYQSSKHSDASSNSGRTYTHSHTHYRYKKSSQNGRPGSKQSNQAGTGANTRQKKSSDSAKQEKQSKQRVYGDFNRSDLEDYITRINNERLKRNLANQKQKRVAKMRKKIQQQRKLWIKRFEQFKKNARVGMYDSLINAILFGKIAVSSQKETSLGPATGLKDKYNITLRHNLIKDRIFYAVNRGVNLVLKYILGVVFSLQFIYNIYQNFYYGYFLGNAGEFIGAQLLVFLQVGLLLVPDNLYQRYILWQFRNLPMNKIKKEFGHKRLPSPYHEQANKLISAKYMLLATLVWFAY